MKNNNLCLREKKCYFKDCVLLILKQLCQMTKRHVLLVFRSIFLSFGHLTLLVFKTKGLFKKEKNAFGSRYFNKLRINSVYHAPFKRNWHLENLTVFSRIMQNCIRRFVTNKINQKYLQWLTFQNIQS